MLKNYLKITIKVLLRNKLFTLISLFGISLTLTILIIAASFYDFTFKSNYPVTKQDRILYLSRVALYDKKLGRGSYNTYFSGQPSYYLLEKCALPLKTPERISIYSNIRNTLSFINSKKAKLVVRYTDDNYWKILEFKVIAGRVFNQNETERGDKVAVITESIASKYYSGPDSALGKIIKVNDTNFAIVGVVKNVPVTSILSAFGNIWVPITTAKDDFSSKELHGDYNAMLLAKKNNDLTEIKSEFQNLLHSSELPMGIYKFIEIDADSFLEMIIRQFQISRSTFYVLLATLIFIIMLIPSLNLINLNVNRISERLSEIGIRKTFGANKINLIGQFLAENIILTLVGGLFATCFSVIFFQVIKYTGIIPLEGLFLNFRILLIGLIFCFCFGLIAGIVPAFRMSRSPIVESLKIGES